MVEVVASYQPGEICWAVGDDLGAVLVTAVLEATPLVGGRTLEVYTGCSFTTGCVPEAIEQFAVVVRTRAVGSASSANSG